MSKMREKADRDLLIMPHNHTHNANLQVRPSSSEPEMWALWLAHVSTHSLCKKIFATLWLQAKCLGLKGVHSHLKSVPLCPKPLVLRSLVTRTCEEVNTLTDRPNLGRLHFSLVDADASTSTRLHHVNMSEPVLDKVSSGSSESLLFSPSRLKALGA